MLKKAIAVREYKELEMLNASEENAWGDNDPNDTELMFGEEETPCDEFYLMN